MKYLRLIIVSITITVLFPMIVFAADTLSLGELSERMNSMGAATATESVAVYSSPNIFDFTREFDTSAVMIFRNGILQPRRWFRTSTISDYVSYTPNPMAAFSISSGIPRGQTFTTSSAINIKTFQIPCSISPFDGTFSGTVTLRFYNTSGGLPTTSIYSQDITNNIKAQPVTITLSSMTTMSVELASSVNLQASTKYAWAIEILGTGTIYLQETFFDNNNAGGIAVYFQSGSWFSTSDHNFLFKVLNVGKTRCEFLTTTNASDEIVLYSTK